MIPARSFLPLAGFLALAACAPETPTMPVAPSPDMAKQVHVEHVRVQYAASFAPGTVDLLPAEKARLASFLDQSDVQPGDSVFLAASPKDPLASQRAGVLAGALARRGLGAVPAAPPPTGVGANQVLVMVDRYVALPPTCPNWSDPSWGDHGNEPNSNFGCATYTDLSLMVANPRDLSTGRTMGPADDQPAADAVERYRTDTVKALSGTSASGGASGGGTTAGATAPSQ
jgi:pilus assembly protein CpaD